MLNYSFDKSKLPYGMSYPLKRSLLDAAFEKFQIVQVYVVYYWTQRHGNIVMRADYLGEANKGWFAAGKSNVTLYAVPSNDRRMTEHVLIEQGLPALCTWLQKAEAAENVWRGTNHSFVIECAQGKLFYFET